MEFIGEEEINLIYASSVEKCVSLLIKVKKYLKKDLREIQMSLIKLMTPDIINKERDE